MPAYKLNNGHPCKMKMCDCACNPADGSITVAKLARETVNFIIGNTVEGFNVRATEIAGHRQVNTLQELYTIPDNILSESGTNEKEDAIGQEWWVQEKGRKYRLNNWDNRKNNHGWIPTEIIYLEGTQIVISETAPADTNDIWANDAEKSLPEYHNEDLQSIQAAIRALTEIVGKHEYAFNNQLDSGNFKNNTADEIMSVEAEAPEGVEDSGTTVDTEYPEYVDDIIPNLKHLCIKAGKYADMLENIDKFLNKELLWCYDLNRLYIKSEGKLVWINKASTSSTGGGSISSDDLDGLTTIGFVAPSGQVYRVKVNNDGELVVYKKELDTPQPEPSGGETDENGWVYVTSLYLQKLYINSLYCGGLTSDEHSYNYCSHNFVELSNLTNDDVNLKGLSLQYCVSGTDWQVLPLEGVIKKGSTFLIRGAQCSVMDANTTRIKVKTYDMEWRDSSGNLIKFDNTKSKFYLTWGTAKSTVANPYTNVNNTIKISKGYIDLVGLNVQNASSTDTVDAKEKSSYAYLNSQRLFTKYYSMDGVKQATKALSARNNANDWYFVDLTKDIIPGVENYTPRASFENKNIFYNKTSLDTTKPNYVTCTFGIQATAPNATRCFNWISKDYYDEYLWYRKQGDSNWTQVESFKNETGIRKYYNRIRSEFTDGTPFVTHKVIIKNLSAGTYEYKVGRDDSYISDVMTFTVVYDPADFSFVQVSDQQGFRWDEYQIWNDSAKFIAENVNDFGFTINTGDLTQNGNRLNEWLDYYDARKPLADKEEMTVIGNNDLAPANNYVLGAGEDNDKLNPINMRYFYTYEMDEENPPIFTIEDKEIFVDSLYSFNYGNTHFMCVNSEIPINTELFIYGLSASGQVYKAMEEWCKKDLQINSNQTWRIAVCHELPFTILTQFVVNQFYWDGKEYPKAERGGSRINTNNTADHTYWFSKFCQNNDIRLVIGGHKHTYAATLPILENEGHSMKPIIQVTQQMLEDMFESSSLAQDTSDPQLADCWFPSKWIDDISYTTKKHLCTFELVDKITAPIYITNQATGYKHTSNKELPSKEVPWDYYFFPCKSVITNQNTVTDTVNAEQRYPFYTVYHITDGEITCTTKRINNLFTSTGKYNVNIPSSSNAPEAIGGNGTINNGNDIIVIER